MSNSSFYCQRGTNKQGGKVLVLKEEFYDNLYNVGVAKFGTRSYVKIWNILPRIVPLTQQHKVVDKFKINDIISKNCIQETLKCKEFLNWQEKNVPKNPRTGFEEDEDIDFTQKSERVEPEVIRPKKRRKKIPKRKNNPTTVMNLDSPASSTGIPSIDSPSPLIKRRVTLSNMYREKDISGMRKFESVNFFYYAIPQLSDGHQQTVVFDQLGFNQNIKYVETCRTPSIQEVHHCLPDVREVSCPDVKREFTLNVSLKTVDMRSTDTSRITTLPGYVIFKLKKKVIDLGRNFI